MYGLYYLSLTFSNDYLTEDASSRRVAPQSRLVRGRCTSPGPAPSVCSGVMTSGASTPGIGECTVKCTVMVYSEVYNEVYSLDV